jgi:hypothetical protein
MSVGVAEVARVDAPGAVVRLVGNGGAGCLGLREERVNVGSAPDDVAEAELAALRRPLRDPGLLGELAARVESENQAAVESELTMAPAGFVSSPAYSVAVTPRDSRPSPSR